MLTGIEIRVADDAREAARHLIKMGARAVVIKGGHLSAESDATDLLYDGRSFVALKAVRIYSDAHGTGCAFSAAIAAHLARGRDQAACAVPGKMEETFDASVLICGSRRM